MMRCKTAGGKHARARAVTPAPVPALIQLSGLWLHCTQQPFSPAVLFVCLLLSVRLLMGISPMWELWEYRTPSRNAWN